MKSKDKKLLTDDYMEDYYASKEYQELLAKMEEDIDISEKQYEQETRRLEANALIERDWELQGRRNYKRLQAKQNKANKEYDESGIKDEDKRSKFIGERIAYLRGFYKKDPVDVYTTAGVAKTTLYRIEKGISVPSEKAISKILYVFDCSLATFANEPDDFNAWKESLEQTNDGDNIYKFRKDVLAKLDSYNFTYSVNGKTEKLPLQHLNIIKSLIASSFDILDLIPHDKKQ